MWEGGVREQERALKHSDQKGWEGNVRVRWMRCKT